ncbi:MAG: CPXCG motif-containing cysteine-rich protein [Gemmatimonadetes bacterium]|uniref:CPXCG motif-containing cysteine-rich protein n=1 Tax=Candidatus Kutchimonas denitrificans TaxID=3056748 RepID=A0AAE5CA55_9BACT|nr:CPXCG motif-containing cysteine-rich protein [Gemmatimonadota bacterium]NIR76156.1 CPXCG motif-containing cysteine-rich protein [Candidatus Kutchimonas denitrificans]NIS00535.1 CPXCG motif-containing cysteine-rich protein [Gemmatimonadota bacterium]NIT66193.1 CPXCG motif-containing cysteine-rich protein [Gemmatimonadota bacterium]NIU54271.1 CPXCG motif-containing cysteine-rich protein [Gemmatimonadota bacterium]
MDADDLDELFPRGDGLADTEATVGCPYCGATSVIVLDPGGGSVQRYVEDCEVCCRPWEVTVRYHGGTAEVRLEPAQDF